MRPVQLNVLLSPKLQVPSPFFLLVLFMLINHYLEDAFLHLKVVLDSSSC